jgi:hypothetical protein
MPYFIALFLRAIDACGSYEIQFSANNTGLACTCPLTEGGNSALCATHLADCRD